MCGVWGGEAESLCLPRPSRFAGGQWQQKWGQLSSPLGVGGSWRFVYTLGSASNRSTPDRFFPFSRHIPQASLGLTSSPSSPEETPVQEDQGRTKRSSSFQLVSSPACSPTHNSPQESAHRLFLLALLLQFMTHSDQIKRPPKELKPTLFYFINTGQFQFGSDDTVAVKRSAHSKSQ